MIFYSVLAINAKIEATYFQYTEFDMTQLL